MNTNKTCKICNEEKLILDFCYCYKKGGYTETCKKCKNSRMDTDNKKIRKAQGASKSYSSFQLK